MACPTYRLCLVSGVFFLLMGAVTHAASLGTAFTHSGEYKPGGVAVTGVYDFQIVLFPAVTGGTPAKATIVDNVPVTQGQFTMEVNYGATPFATATQYWLETRVRPGTSTGAFTILTPRRKLTAVPYALSVRTLPPNSVTGSNLAANAVGTVAILNNSITAADIGSNAVGLTEINPTQVQVRVSGICAVGTSMRAIGQNGTVVCEADGVRAWRLGGNAGTNPNTQFLGTTDNQPVNVRVNNQRVLRLEPNAISPNVIGGSAANFVMAGVRGATISGGGVPSGTDPDFPGDEPNRVTDTYGTVGGGFNNQAGDNAGTLIDHAFATVAGGSTNTASGLASTVTGGFGNTASDTVSTVAGGYSNTAGGRYSTVAGGQSNTAGGRYSTVAGGSDNIASGDYSFVVGRQAKNTDPAHDGVFMFADSQNADFFSAGLNTFNIRAQGGLHLNPQTNLFFGAQTRQMLNLWGSAPTYHYGIGVQPNTLYFRSGDHFAWFRQGAHIEATVSPGAGGTLQMRLDENGNLVTRGAVNPTSDRNLKTDFTAVDTAAVLAQVAALPIQSWRYKDDRSTRHIGPMAQDFHAAFQLGMDDKHIATVDADGVALAAIQGLNQKLEAENAKLQAENTKIKARLEALEAQAAKQERTQARLEILEAQLERLFQARAAHP